MNQNRLKPKYILLATPTLKHSRSTIEPSLLHPSFDGPSQPKLTPLPEISKQNSCHMKSNPTAKDFASIKDELSQCMHAIGVEKKRNYVLTELNKMLKKVNSDNENTEKRIIKPKLDKDRRQIEKEEYELDQILQKHNEQVARITNLRQQVNAARTDRVVFSALFKKIEREIKHYQNMYRQMIIKSEICVRNKTAALENQKDQQNYINDEVQAFDESLNYLSKAECKDEADRLFMTSLDKTHHHRMLHKRGSQRYGDPSHILIAQISQMEQNIERVIKTVQCNSPEEAVRRFNCLEDENNRLLQSINETQYEIDDVQEQIERLLKQRRNSEIYQQRHMKKLTNIPSTRKLRSLRSLKTGETPQHLQVSHQIDQILTSIGYASSEKMIDIIAGVQQTVNNDTFRRESSRQSEQCVDIILQKMQKFQHCERILSKDQFQRQYFRQMGRQRKPAKNKR